MTYYNFEAESETFPKYIVYDDFLSSEEFGKMMESINLSSDVEKLWEPSEIFSSQLGSNMKNPEIRKSQKIALHKLGNSLQLFNLLNTTLIKKINENQKDDTEFKLVFDEIDLIKYIQGDYFKRHHDFVHINSNQIKCYALILCLKGDCEGGETSLFLNDEETVICSSTKIPNGVLIMRNEISHQANEVLQGEKIVLKLNLIAIKKTTNTLVTISFKDDSRLYYLTTEMINVWPNSYLASALHFQNTMNIVIEKFTYDEFSIIHSILIGHRPKLEIINNNKTILDYFGYNMNFETTIYNHFKLIFKQSLAKMDKFLNKQDTKNCILYSSSSSEHQTFKTYFASNSKILPIEWIYTDTEINFIRIEPYFVYVNCENRDLSISEITASSIEESNLQMLEYLFIVYCKRRNYKDCKQCQNIQNKIKMNAHQIGDNEEKHNKSCTYDVMNIKDTISGLLTYSNSSMFCKYLMTSLLQFTEIEYAEEWYSQPFIKNTVIDPTLKSAIKLDEIQSIVLQVKKDLLQQTLIKSESERVIGAYECNSVEYYEKVINLGLGFINLEKYL